MCFEFIDDVCSKVRLQCCHHSWSYMYILPLQLCWMCHCTGVLSLSPYWLQPYCVWAWHWAELGTLYWNTFSLSDCNFFQAPPPMATLWGWWLWSFFVHVYTYTYVYSVSGFCTQANVCDFRTHMYRHTITTERYIVRICKHTIITVSTVMTWSMTIMYICAASEDVMYVQTHKYPQSCC